MTVSKTKPAAPAAPEAPASLLEVLTNTSVVEDNTEAPEADDAPPPVETERELTSGLVQVDYE